MLRHLTIRNYALVTATDLSFENGMTVVTGETGAGKSIMLDALGLTLGDRADNQLIANGKDRAEIISTFSLGTNTDVQAMLANRDIPVEDDELILRRVVTREGRSRAYINGIPSTLGDLREIGSRLVDIHSQHEHQSLLKKETHRRLLDEFGGLQDDVAGIAERFNALRDRQQRLEALINDATENSARLQLLTYQAGELEELAVAQGEVETLQDTQKQLASADTDQEQVQLALQVLTADDSPLDAIRRAQAALSTLTSPGIDSIRETLASGIIQLEEAGADLDRFADSLEADPALLARTEARLDAIYTIARKHHVDANALPELQAQIEGELGRINNASDEIEALEAEIAGIRADYDKQAGKLRGARAKAAAKLEKAVTRQLSDLGMKGASLGINLGERSSPFAEGLDDIEFLIATNQGQDHGPLNRIASGGELSRISLAIQVETAATSEVPTLVFDEVDVGIGGGVAEVVGNRLRSLGEQAQIVCVTHLAQVAAQGHQHFSVAKELKGKSATTAVLPLDAEASVQEIARMMGGIEVTEQTRAHAQEMYDRAQG